MTNRPKKKNHKPMRRCGSRSIIILLAIAIVGATAFGITAEPRPMRAQRRVTRIQINDFALTDQNSTPFEFKNLAGKVVVVAFAYTTCPDVCPLITASLRQVQSGLTKEERKHVRLMTVTTDPEIDSPKVLTAYAKRYGAEFDNWSFLTGNLSVLEKILQNFGVGVERKGRGLIDHTPLTAVVDQKKLMRLAYIGPSPDPKAVLADVRAMLREH
jgi:protein SCO1/2